MSDTDDDIYDKCCRNVGVKKLVYCDKPATHWYLHNDDVCSYCDEHNYQCGEKIDNPAQKSGSGIL